MTDELRGKMDLLSFSKQVLEAPSNRPEQHIRPLLIIIIKNQINEQFIIRNVIHQPIGGAPGK